MAGAAIVTGAGAGIGRAAALALAARGFHIVAGDIDRAAAAEVCGAIAATGGLGEPAVLDVTDDAQVRDLVDRFAPAGLTALVHSAGLFPKASFAASTSAQLDQVMAVNFRAAFVLAKAAQSAMGDGGAMIFLTSGAGLMSAIEDPMQADFSIYGASKAALDRWALGVAPELARRGILVNTLTPGAFVHTPGLAALALQEARGGEAISAERVAEAIAYLAQRREPALAGQRLRATEFGRGWGRA